MQRKRIGIPIVIRPRPNRSCPPHGCAALKAVGIMPATGVDLVDFGGGEPDFETPLCIQEAGIRATQAGETRYTDIEGTAQLRLAIRRYFERYYGLRYGDDAVLASVGAKQASLHALLALVNPGDGVILPAPFWVSFPEQIRRAEGVARILPTRAEHAYHLDPAELERAITPSAKASS